MSDAAVIWIRVSTGKQDEASQLPDIQRYCDERGYDVRDTITVHGESAYKGEQDPYWTKAVETDADVIVCWKVDRLDRRNILTAVPMVNKAIAVGKRVEFATQPFIDLTMMQGRIAFATFCEMAHEESRIKSDRIRAKQSALRVAGSIVGRAPWGFEIVSRGDVKVLEPTPLARHWVPQIYQWAIDGKSTRDIAALLDKHGVLPTYSNSWFEHQVRRMLANPIYRGKRKNGGALETEPLVSVSVWEQANAATESRATLPGRSTTTYEKALLKPYCGVCWGQIRPGCFDGKSVMYRRPLGGTKGRPVYLYYRCDGSGPQRKGCGAKLIPCKTLDQAVIDIMLEDQRAHQERVFVPGDDYSEQIEELKLRQESAQSRAEVNQIWDEIEALQSRPIVKAHWDTVDTGLTEAEYFESLDLDERRTYLREWEIIASKDAEAVTVTVVHKLYIRMLGWPNDDELDAVTPKD